MSDANRKPEVLLVEELEKGIQKAIALFMLNNMNNPDIEKVIHSALTSLLGETVSLSVAVRTDFMASPQEIEDTIKITKEAVEIALRGHMEISEKRKEQLDSVLGKPQPTEN